MFANALLLWGLCGIAVPILIHLLLRQRPRPRAWAAMRWLLAAARAAQRRWRLTNLLLLLLRCLVIALLALALARPNLGGLGSGGHLVLVVDVSASMGARGGDPGPLAAAQASLARGLSAVAEVSIIAVGERVTVVADRQAPASALRAFAALNAEPLPGGLDDGLAEADSPRANALASSLDFSGADAVLLSDFQQDDGASCTALLARTARSVVRWRVGEAGANAVVAGAGLAEDGQPGQPGELVIAVHGAPAGAALSVDDGPFLDADLGSSGLSSSSTGRGTLRLALPALLPGAHRLHVRLADAGLSYDNHLELPITLRGPQAALLISDRYDAVGAALAADSLAFTSRRVAAAGLSGETLPQDGLVVLRQSIAEGARVAEWVRGGGVLWLALPLLRSDPGLAALVPHLVPEGSARVPGGALGSGEKDLDEVLAIGAIADVPALTLPAGSEVLLRAGSAPLIVAVRCGRGFTVIEAVDLGSEPAFAGRGTAPLFVVRSARRLAARNSAPPVLIAGEPAPAGAILRRGSEVVRPAAGARLLAAPGLWMRSGDQPEGPVLILPSPSEGRLERGASPEMRSSLGEALPRSQGADLGPWLLAALLALALGEGLFAAWAGKTYGR